MTTTDPGTYLEIDGRPAVRFERVYPHAVERVWRAVTDPAQMRHWFPSPEVAYDGRTGGTMTLSGDPYAPEPRTSTVLVWDPPHRFSFGWGGDELHFTLSDAGDGCRLVMVDLLSSEGAAARNAAGWEACLEQLARTVEGRPGAGAAGGGQAGGMDAFRPVLEQYKAAGLPDDGWLPDET